MQPLYLNLNREILLTLSNSIKAARKAFSSWALLDLSKRIEYLHSFSKQLELNKEALATLISEEVGKPLWDALTEVGAMQSKIEISIKAYDERTGIREEPPLFTRHRPHGVLGVLGPFNFPGHLPNGHIVPALLAGNTIVFKPSAKTPKVAEKTMELWKKAGLPEGVLNLVQGDKEIAQELAFHSEIDGLLFTGSYEVGLMLSQHFAKTPGKILALEMGGNNPLVVWDVKDLKAAVYTIIQSAYITSGQRCTCARRLIVPEKSHELLNLLKEALYKIKIGPYTDRPEPFMGPLVSKEAANNMMEAEKRLISMGAQSIVKMTQNEAFVTPGLINVSSIKDLPDEEYFGPLLQVQEARTFEEALDLAFKTKFGLVTSLLSDKKELYDKFYIHAKAGVVNWNTPTTGSSSKMPFGGIGCSGNQRPSAYYAADYCAYPVASSEIQHLMLPSKLLPGIEL